MSPARRVILLAFVVLLLSGCGGTDAADVDVADADRMPLSGYVEGQSYGLEWSFDEMPRVGEVAFSLSAERLGTGNEGDEAMSDVEATVEAWMPGHAHGLPDQPPVAKVGPGRYEVSGLVLTMTGTWEIEVTLRDGVATEQLGFSVDVE